MKFVQKLGLVVLMLAVASSSLKADDSEWTSMFNGKDLTGWRVNEDPKSVTAASGMIIVYGPRAHAFYEGKDGKAEFKNFHFKAQVLTTKGSNSGIYFHTRYQESGWPNKGYEAQVNNTQGDPKMIVK